MRINAAVLGGAVGLVLGAGVLGVLWWLRPAAEPWAIALSKAIDISIAQAIDHGRLRYSLVGNGKSTFIAGGCVSAGGGPCPYAWGGLDLQDGEVTFKVDQTPPLTGCPPWGVSGIVWKPWKIVRTPRTTAGCIEACGGGKGLEAKVTIHQVSAPPPGGGDVKMETLEGKQGTTAWMMGTTQTGVRVGPNETVYLYWNDTSKVFEFRPATGQLHRL